MQTANSRFALLALSCLLPALASAQIPLTRVNVNDPTVNAGLGDNVDIEGDLAVAGAPGAEATYVFRKVAGAWSQEAKLTPSVGSSQLFGISPAVTRTTSGDEVVAVGAVFHVPASGDLSGGVFTFRNVGGSWQEEDILVAPDAKHVDFFGARLAMDRDVLVVGAPNDELSGPPNTNTGTIYVYERSGNAWQPASPQHEFFEFSGADLNNGSQFGGAVAVTGVPGNERIAVGSSHSDLTPGQGGTNEGSTYVYHKVSGNWTEEVRLLAEPPGIFELLGWNVAISGDFVVSSAIYDDEVATNAGAVYIHRVTNWTAPPLKLTAPDGVAGDRFGELVAIDGDLLLVGTLFHADHEGAVYSSRWDGSGWSPLEKTPNPSPAADDDFGIVGIHQGEVIAGAWHDDESDVNAGAVYFGHIDNVPVGANVSVRPMDSTTDELSVLLSFSNVTSAGTVTVTSSTNGPPPPSGFQLGSQNIYYELTASPSLAYTGTITVCIHYDENDFGNESNLVLQHAVNGIWEDPPPLQTLDTLNDIICAEVSSLSPFAVMEAQDVVGSLQELITDVVELNLQQGISNSLDAKLSAALGALSDAHAGNDHAAINALQAFVNAVQAQAGSWIPTTDAADLVDGAQQVIGVLSGS